MKNILISLFLLNLYNKNYCQVTPRYSITIWDVNSSLAYTLVYTIDNDSLKVNRIGGLVNERSVTLLKRQLTADESKSLYKFLSSFPIDKLKNNYKGDEKKVTVLDGDQKTIKLEFNNKVKKIDLYNYYQKNIDSLFQFVNKLIPNKEIKLEFDVAH